MTWNICSRPIPEKSDAVSADTIGKILERESGKVSGDLIQVLVCDEIYKRRHGGKRGMIAFL